MVCDNQIIFATPVEFVRTFPRINITPNQRIILGRIRKEDNILEHCRGSSRDEPTFSCFPVQMLCLAANANMRSTELLIPREDL